VTPATVRYYARIGLLHPGRDAQNGYRRFTRDDLQRVVFVRKAQALGLTISDIRTILGRLEHGDSVCDMVVDMVQQRLEEIGRQCLELEASKARIERALADWSDRAPCPNDSNLCPLIEQTEVEAANGGRHTGTAVGARHAAEPGRHCAAGTPAGSSAG
jgi:DNA-binding transcriptional MerR regulator